MAINNDIVPVSHLTQDFEISDLDNSAWDRAGRALIDRYWSGDQGPLSRRSTARLLWSDEALYVKFESAQNEPLIVSDKPVLTQKTIGLWDRDVCEIFVAPTSQTPSKYFEFEVAPTGEWVDLAISFQAGRRNSDLDFSSGIRSAARIESGRIISAIKIPSPAFGATPKTGDIWRGNLFRCVGKEPTRGYLAWQPTFADEPNFHVPERFGSFVFVD